MIEDWKFKQIPVFICSYLLGVGRNPAVEEKGLVVPEKIFLKYLRDDQPLLQMSCFAVQVVGGEAGEVLAVVGHPGHAGDDSLQQEKL